MPLDSLGLGLTLDTTLLEKADKTLENMHKNSKLIMQNLTRGFTSFNSGGADALTKMSTALGHVSDALTKIDNAKVSPDFDTKGQEKYIGRMQHLLDMVEKLSKTRGAKFYDPTEIYVTDKTSDKISGEIAEVREHKEELSKLLDVIDDYNTLQKELQKTINQTDNELAAQNNKLKANAESYRKLREEQEKAEKTLQSQYKRFATTQLKKDSTLTEEALSSMFKKRTEDPSDSMNKYAIALSQANEKLKKEEEALGETLKKIDELEKKNIEAKKEYQKNLNIYQNRDQIKSSYDILKEEEKILKAELKFSQATQAERAAMLTKKNEAEIKADQKRIRDVQKSYEQLRKEIQKGEKDIADLEASRQTLKEANRPTKGIDNEIKKRRNELNKLMQDELEFRSSQYWPKLQAIDEKFNSEAFIKNQKALAKLAAKESRKDVTAALQFSRNAQTINEEKEAIKRLVEARDNLSTSTARYKKTVEDINKRILAHKDHIEAVTRVEKEQNTLADSVINRYRKQLKELDELNEALDDLAKKQQNTGALYTAEEARARIDLTNRRDTVQKDILEIEKNAQGELDVIKEQHEAERAKKTVDSILKQNEREKQEYAKLLDDLYALEKQKKSMEDAGAKKGVKAYDNILQQEQDLNNQISQLKAKHQKDLDEIDKRHAKKRNDDEVKAFIDAQKEKLRIAEETQKEIAKNNEKYGTISKRGAAAEIQTYKYAENIAQHKQAVEKLQIVRTKLDNTDKDYYQTLKKLNQEIHSHELFIRAAENESVRLGNSHRGLMDISGQLMRRLALVFSVSQITQYFRKLVEVRGQFEKTEVALTSIVGSQEKSNKLMNQTIALAIKSPFTLQQLTGYTKQLAAYQVAYEQLHDTTKMLADVSAGLGVEMDRLILAFGQVKAANYLRATEVRQFTEAGFNILGELAKYYSELEGTMVSVGDVQERVTKRMVDFADVEEIFHRVTEAGGMFYEMQSKQAETLAGQWTNLQDRIDVMLNEIGTDKENILKFFVKFLASAIDNWEVLASSIKTAAAAFLIFKTYSLLAGDGIKLLAIQMGVLTDSVPKVLSLGQAFNTLGRVVKSAVTKIGTSMSALLTNPIFLAIAAIGALIGAGFSLYRHFDKVKDALKEQSDSFNEYTSSLNKLSKEYNKLDKFTEKLAKLEELKSRLNERGLNLSVKIDEVNTDNIDEIFTENSEILQKSYDLGLSVGNAITRGINAAQGNIFGWSLFGENLAEDAEDFAGKWNKLASYGMDAQMTAMTNEIEATIAAMNDMTEEEKSSYAEMLKIYEEIKDGRKAEKDDKGKIIKYLESEYEWTIRRATVLKEIQDLEDGSVTKNNKLARYLRQVARQEKELNHEVENTVNKLAKEFDGLENLMQAAKDNPVEFSAAIQAEVDKQAWDEVTKWVYSQKLHARLDITPNYVEDPNATADKVYKGFKKDLMDARSKLSKITDKDGQSLNYQNFFISTDEIDNMKAFSDGLEGIQKLYNENKKTIEQLDGTSSSYNKEELDRLNALQNALKEVAKKWGYDLDLNAKGGQSEALKKLKDQIKLIKEANKAYEERNKKFGKEDSKAVVSESYKDAFKELKLDIEKIDYTNLEGVVKALEDLEKKAKEAEGETEWLKEIAEVKAEIGLTLKERQDKALFNQVQEIFDDYELAVDIKKLNLPPELAKKLFGVDTKTFDQMRTEIVSKFAGTNEEIRKILSKGNELSVDDERILIDAIGKERVDKAKESLDKIDDLEKKQQLESAKRFVKFLTKNLDQTKVIMSQKGIDIAYAKEQFDKGAISAQTFAEVVREISKQANDDISKINFENFKEGSLYIKAMGNLAAYSARELKAMAKELKKALAENAKDMGVDELQAYHQALARINKETKKFNPFISENEISQIAEYLKLQKELREEQEKQKELQGERVRLDNQRKSLVELLEQASSRQQQGELVSTNNLASNLQKTEGAIQGIDSMLSNSEMNISNISGQIGEIVGTGGGGAMGVVAMIDKIVQAVNDTCNAAKKTFEDIMEMADSFGVETDKGSWREASNFFEGMSNFNAEVTEGWENLKSGNIFGAIANTIGSISGFIRDVNKWKDSNLEETLQKHREEVEELQTEYEKLEWVIERALSFDKYGKVAQQTENLGKQIEHTSKAIALEEDKKDTDEDTIKELRENAEEARKQIHELYDNLREEIVGSYEDLSSTLADAMIDALKNGENALKAWSDEVDNIIANIVTKLAVQKYVEPQVSSVLDKFYNEVMPKNAAAEKAFTRLQSMTVGTKEYEKALAEWEKLNSQAIGELPQLTENSVNNLKESLNAIGLSFEPLAEKIAGIFGGQQSGELSSLQKGIQGITEETAQVIEAYLNSVRGYVSEQVTHTKNIYNLLRNVSSRDGTTALQVRMIS